MGHARIWGTLLCSFKNREGCSVRVFSTCEGVVTIDFSREDDSLQNAIRSAIANVQADGCTVSKVEMEADSAALKV